MQNLRNQSEEVECSVQPGTSSLTHNMTSPASLNAWKHHLDLDSLLFSFDVQAKCFKVVERAVQKSTLSTRVFNPSLTRTYRPHGVIESTCRHVSIQNHLHSSFWLHADGSLNYPEGAAVYRTALKYVRA